MSSPPGGPTPSPRAERPVRITRLGAESGDDLSADTTPAERVELVWELSRRMWALTGRAWPATPRGELPVRLLQSP